MDTIGREMVPDHNPDSAGLPGLELEKETDTEELLFILRIFLETRAYFSKREEVVPTNIIDQPLQSGAGDLHSTLECSRMITS